MNISFVRETKSVVVLAAALVAGLLLLGALQPASAATSSTQSDSSAQEAAPVFPQVDTEVYEKRVQKWINVQRAKHNLKPLTQESCTDGVAEAWGTFLADNNEFFHQDMGKVLDKCHATYAGETLAMGAVGPRKIVSLWMHSPGHRAIVLSKSPRRIGIGAHPDVNGAWVVAANFTRF